MASAAHPAGRGSDPAAWRRTGLVVLLAAVIFVPLSTGRELMPPDEPRFALVAAEMVERGDPVLPTRGGELYLDKPPLLFWLQSIGLLLLGERSELATRLPSLLATLALVALLHRAGRRWYGEPRATWAALVYLSFSLVLQRGAWVATDPLLVLATFGLVDALDRARTADGARRWGSVAAAWVAVGLLAKGPVILVFLLLAFIAALATPGWRLPLTPLLRPVPLLVLAALALPWPLLLAGRVGVDTLVETLWRQNVGRFAQSWDNIEPWWYHAESLGLGLLPWSLVLWAAAVPRMARPLWHHPPTRWLMLWALLATIFFSLPAGKRGVYLLPVYPALALVTADLVERLLGDARLRRIAAIVVGAVAALVGVGAMVAGLAGSPPLPDLLADLPAVRRGAVLLLALVAAGWALLAWWLRHGSARLIAGALLPAVAGGLLAPVVINPALDQAQSAAAFGEAARTLVPADADVVYTRTKWELLTWYTRRPGPWVSRADAVRAHLAQPGESYVIGRITEVGPPEKWPPGTRMIYQARVGRAHMIVLAGGAGDTAADRPATILSP